MKKIFAAGLVIVFIVSVMGCQGTKTNAVEGAVIGGVLGAAAGGIIGHQSHHGGEGAGIGAAVGVVSGAVIGSQIEKKQSGQAAPQGTQAQNPNQMSTEQIIDMSKQGIHEDVIVDKIRLSNSRFVLSPDDINNLKQQGVSQKVINAMQGV